MEHYWPSLYFRVVKVSSMVVYIAFKDVGPIY